MTQSYLDDTIVSNKEITYMKRLNSFLYTKGKFGKGYRQTADINTEYLYSKARYKTKIKKKTYLKIILNLGVALYDI